MWLEALLPVGGEAGHLHPDQHPRVLTDRVEVRSDALLLAQLFERGLLMDPQRVLFEAGAQLSERVTDGIVLDGPDSGTGSPSSSAILCALSVSCTSCSVSGT